MKYLSVLILALILFPSTTYSITPPWSSTLNCPEWIRTDTPGGGSVPVSGCPDIESGGPYACTLGGTFYAQITTSANNPTGGGGRGLRHWLGYPQENGSSATQIRFNSSPPEFWFRWYMRFQQGFYWSGYNGYKMLYLHGSSFAGYFGYPYISNSGRFVINGGSGGVPTCQGCGWQFLNNGSDISDGRWHSYEMHYKENSPQIFEFWIDGVLKISDSTVNYGSGGVTWIELGSNALAVGNSTCQAVDYDDMVISTTGYIGPISGGGGGVPDYTAPSTPAGLMASAISSSQINLSWTASTDPDDAVSGYNIYRNGIKVSTSAVNSYSSTGLSPSTTYSYMVDAYDTHGNTSTLSSSYSTTTQSTAPSGQTLILFDGFESLNLNNWHDDYRAGGETFVTSPVFGGSYALQVPTDNAGTYAHFFADHPGIGGAMVDDVTLEEYLYVPSNAVWPDANASKLWLMNCFESWTAGYNLAAGQGKPNAWAPYYITLSINQYGQPFGQLTRADGLGGTGELWTNLWQNQGSPIALTKGAWNKMIWRMKLNTLGQSNGILQIWVNDVLKANYSSINYRGTYSQYGWNHLIMYISGNYPQRNLFVRDNIALYSSSQTLTQQPPSAPTNLQIR